MSDTHPLIAFACPHCEEELRAAGSLAGRMTICPYCDQPLTVPLESDADLPPTDEIAIEPTSVTRFPPPRPSS